MAEVTERASPLKRSAAEGERETQPGSAKRICSPPEMSAAGSHTHTTPRASSKSPSPSRQSPFRPITSPRPQPQQIKSEQHVGGVQDNEFAFVAANQRQQRPNSAVCRVNLILSSNSAIIIFRRESPLALEFLQQVSSYP